MNFVKDNRLCVAGEKSKLLIVGSEKVKRTRLKNKLVKVVDEDIIEGTKNEKLLERALAL